MNLIIGKELPMTNACEPNGPYIITISNAIEISPPSDRTNPGFYANELNCTWKIIAARNKRIVLEIKGNQDFEIEQKYTSITLIDFPPYFSIQLLIIYIKFSYRIF